MLKKLIGNSLLKRFATLRLPRRNFPSFPKMANIGYTRPLLIAKTTLFVHNMQNFDLNLQQACDVGESAIVDLMNLLKERIVETCKAYRECLQKQMEVIREASELGSLSERWDDLPEYRILAQELTQELSNYIALLNTIGQMVHEESLRYITDHKEYISLIDAKCRELEEVLKEQIKEIKKSEAMLLQLKRESILKAA